jgi:hypothetical protein
MARNTMDREGGILRSQKRRMGEIMILVSHCKRDDRDGNGSGNEGHVIPLSLRALALSSEGTQPEMAIAILIHVSSIGEN